MRIFPLLVLFLWFSGLSAQPKQAKSLTLIQGLEKAASISVTRQHLFVVESENHRFKKFDLGGQFIESMGKLGSGNYQFHQPVDIEASNGLKIFVSDLNNNRIQVYDRRFQFLSSIETSKTSTDVRPFEPTFITVNNIGELFFYDASVQQIRRFNTLGRIINSFPLLNQVKSFSGLKWHSGLLYILDSEQDVIQIFQESGFYSGFYPAHAATAFDVDDTGIWMANDKQIRQFPFKGTEKIADVSLKSPLKDIVVSDEIVYLLTETSVIRFEF